MQCDNYTLSGLAQVTAVALGPLRALLGTEPLTLTQLGVCALVAVLPGAALCFRVAWHACVGTCGPDRLPTTVRRSRHDHYRRLAEGKALRRNAFAACNPGIRGQLPALRRTPFNRLFLLYVAMLSLALWTAIVSDHAADPASPVASATMVWVFAALAVIGSAPLYAYFRKVGK